MFRRHLEVQSQQIMAMVRANTSSVASSEEIRAGAAFGAQR